MPGVSSRLASAMSLVTTSSATTTSAAAQKIRRSATLAILFLFLAGDAEPGMRQRIQPLERDLGAAGVALPELLRGLVQPAERLVHVPEVPALLRGEQELLLPLHGVRALVGHMEGIGREVAVGRLQRGVERLVVVPQLLHDARPLFE